MIKKISIFLCGALICSLSHADNSFPTPLQKKGIILTTILGAAAGLYMGGSKKTPKHQSASNPAFVGVDQHGKPVYLPQGSAEGFEFNLKAVGGLILGGISGAALAATSLFLIYGEGKTIDKIWMLLTFVNVATNVKRAIS